VAGDIIELGKPVSAFSRVRSSILVLGADIDTRFASLAILASLDRLFFVLDYATGFGSITQQHFIHHYWCRIRRLMTTPSRVTLARPFPASRHGAGISDRMLPQLSAICFVSFVPTAGMRDITGPCRREAQFWFLGRGDGTVYNNTSTFLRPAKGMEIFSIWVDGIGGVKEQKTNQISTAGAGCWWEFALGGFGVVLGLGVGVCVFVTVV
jgi:hypothetical protein